MSRRPHTTSSTGFAPRPAILAGLLSFVAWAGCAAAADPPPGPHLKTGIDVLVENNHAKLHGKRVGLITNLTGHDRHRTPTIDLLHDHPDVDLVALFSPEHGIRGELDHPDIPDSNDPRTGLPIHSLYGERRAPSPEQLEPLDALLFDIKDIGCRFYTYFSTLVLAMEAAEAAGIRVIVADRPNPIGGAVEGPVLNAPRSFVAAHKIPLRHGHTLGELARLVQAERFPALAFEVIACADGNPLDWFDTTGLPWTNPSPNMRSLQAATLYPGVALIEFCHISVGRGTDSPFEWIGAPYINEHSLHEALVSSELAGIGFIPVRFTPESGPFAGEECQGVRFVLRDRDLFQPVDLGIALGKILHRLHPDKIRIERMDRLLGCPDTLRAIRADRPINEIRELWQPGLRDFEQRIAPHRLYPR